MFILGVLLGVFIGVGSLILASFVFGPKSDDQHKCEEFTQWAEHQANYSRPATLEEKAVGMKTVEFTRRWQERQCTICGAIYQRELH